MLAETRAIAGYDTRAATSIALDRIPAKFAKRLPRYPAVPAVLITKIAEEPKDLRRNCPQFVSG